MINPEIRRLHMLKRAHAKSKVKKTKCSHRGDRGTWGMFTMPRTARDQRATGTLSSKHVVCAASLISNF